MKSIRYLICTAIFVSGIALVAASSRAEEPGKWQSLFNGKDLSGWVSVNDGVFVVTNGNLRLVKGNGWLRTESKYSDFIFEAEWCALEPAYDSGFLIRSGLEGKPWPKDAWQINLKSTSLGALVKGTKTVVPAETPRMPVGKWVKFRIEVRGRKLTLDVDGERAWEFSELDEVSGNISIQAEDKAFNFRNLRIQDLSAGGRPK